MSLPAIETKTERLDNGLVFCGNESKEIDSIALVGSVRAGAMFDPIGKFGTAELVSRLLTRGTISNLDASTISKKIEEAGATLQFINNDERIKFSAKCHSRAIGDLLEILSECLTNPSFPDEQIELAKAEIVADLDSEKDQTRTTAYRRLMSLIYGEDEPYGRNPLGKSTDIQKISREDIRSFYSEHYGADLTLIVATGRFAYSDLLSKIDEKFSKWNSTNSKTEAHFPSSSSSSYSSSSSSSSSPLSSSSSQEAGRGRQETVSMNFKSQVDIAIGAQAVPRKSDLYYPLFLGNLLLGQIGLYGRLGKNVRDEKGLAYYSFSSLVAKSFAGHLAIYAGVNPKNTTLALRGISQEISKIRREAIQEDELAVGKRNSVGSLSISLDTPSERVNIIHDKEYYSLGGPEYFQEYEQKINSVTADQIMKEFDEILSPSNISLAVAGPIQDQRDSTLSLDILQEEQT